jgi:hypothetical protein
MLVLAELLIMGEKNLEIDMGCGVGLSRRRSEVVDKSIALAIVAAAHMAWYWYSRGWVVSRIRP